MKPSTIRYAVAIRFSDFIWCPFCKRRREAGLIGADSISKNTALWKCMDCGEIFTTSPALTESILGNILDGG